MRDALILAALVCLCTGSASATTLIPFDADDLVDHAELIFVGTAVAEETAVTADGEYPFTFVTFTVDDVLKGRIDDVTLTLRLDGGDLPHETVEVVGMPTFELDRRYLLFVRGNGRLGCPVLGWRQGHFGFRPHPSRRGADVLVDSQGVVVEGLGDGDWIKADMVVGDDGAARAVRHDDGVRILSTTDGVVIGDVQARQPAGRDLVPAATVLATLRARVDQRAARSSSFVAGTTLRSARPADVPEKRVFTAGPPPDVRAEVPR